MFSAGSVAPRNTSTALDYRHFGRSGKIGLRSRSIIIGDLQGLEQKTRFLKEQKGTETTERCWSGQLSVFFVCFVSSVRKGSAMHPLFAEASALTHDMIGAAMEVPRDKGLGLLESISMSRD
jgi:hypothetical protein